MFRTQGDDAFQEAVRVLSLPETLGCRALGVECVQAAVMVAELLAPTVQGRAGHLERLYGRLDTVVSP